MEGENVQPMVDNGRGNEMNGVWRQQIQPLPQMPAGNNRNPSAIAREMRQNLMNYFLNEGRLEWQNDYI